MLSHLLVFSFHAGWHLLAANALSAVRPRIGYLGLNAITTNNCYLGIYLRLAHIQQRYSRARNNTGSQTVATHRRFSWSCRSSVPFARCGPIRHGLLPCISPSTPLHQTRNPSHGKLDDICCPLSVTDVTYAVVILQALLARLHLSKRDATNAKKKVPHRGKRSDDRRHRCAG